MNHIDHDPNEVKIDRKFPAPWILLAVLIAIFWSNQWYFRGIDWPQIMLGVGTGAVLASWAIEVTGNKVPDSWLTKPPSSD